MIEQQFISENGRFLSNLLAKRTAFAEAKQEYIHSIEHFCGNQIENVRIKFYGNKMYVTFESWVPFDDKFLLKFCNEFDLLSPTIEVHQYTNTGLITSYKWKFIKILER